jgi:hypothetical protein
MTPTRAHPVSRISPVTDTEAARLARPATLADLADQITATPAGPVPARPQPSGRGQAAGRRPPTRRRWLIGIPLAAGLAAAVLIVTALGRPGQRVGPVDVGPAPAQAQALSFTRHGGYIYVTVGNPVADPAKYRAEFARHHLDITLRLVPASPSIVGTVVYFDQSAGSSPIRPITAIGRCHTGGGGAACPVGLRIPVDFHGQADLVFGRAARPGEKYDSTASAFAPGEVMHGMTVKGQRVAQVLAALRRRHVSVPLFNYSKDNFARNLRTAPGRWYVYDAVPWAPGQVLLFVGPTPTQSLGSGRPAPGQPVASPSPTSSAS